MLGCGLVCFVRVFPAALSCLAFDGYFKFEVREFSMCLPLNPTGFRYFLRQPLLCSLLIPENSCLISSNMGLHKA